MSIPIAPAKLHSSGFSNCREIYRKPLHIISELTVEVKLVAPMTEQINIIKNKNTQELRKEKSSRNILSCSWWPLLITFDLWTWPRCPWPLTSDIGPWPWPLYLTCDLCMLPHLLIVVWSWWPSNLTFDLGYFDQWPPLHNRRLKNKLVFDLDLQYHFS